MVSIRLLENPKTFNKIIIIRNTIALLLMYYSDLKNIKNNLLLYLIINNVFNL